MNVYVKYTLPVGLS